MKIKLFTIPNFLTLETFCGAVAVMVTLQTSNYYCAGWLLIVASIFDFLDGFAARMLNQCSPIGRELDSLADMVSFGLAPSIIMLSLIFDSETMIAAPRWGEYRGYIALLIVAFSSLRLAKFNIDETQTCSFVGLPTPACALMCISLGFMHHFGHPIAAEVVAAIAVVLSWLLISPIRMFSFKLKGLAWSDNCIQYIFVGCIAWIAITTSMLGVMTFALPIIIATYIIISLISHFAVIKSSKRRYCEIFKIYIEKKFYHKGAVSSTDHVIGSESLIPAYAQSA